VNLASFPKALAVAHACRRLGIDPVELRRRNLVPAGAMPYVTGFPGQVYDGGDYERLLDLATQRADYAGVRRRQQEGEALGVGVALCVESTGIGAPEPSRVVVGADGHANVYVGSTPQGQGHLTFLAQVAADRLGWPLAGVTVHVGDSRHVTHSMVTAALLIVMPFWRSSGSKSVVVLPSSTSPTLCLEPLK